MSSNHSNSTGYSANTLYTTSIHSPVFSQAPSMLRTGSLAKSEYSVDSGICMDAIMSDSPMFDNIYWDEQQSSQAEYEAVDPTFMVVGAGSHLQDENQSTPRTLPEVSTSAPGRYSDALIKFDAIFPDLSQACHDAALAAMSALHNGSVRWNSKGEPRLDMITSEQIRAVSRKLRKDKNYHKISNWGMFRTAVQDTLKHSIKQSLKRQDMAPPKLGRVLHQTLKEAALQLELGMQKEDDSRKLSVEQTAAVFLNVALSSLQEQLGKLSAREQVQLETQQQQHHQQLLQTQLHYQGSQNYESYQGHHQHLDQKLCISTDFCEQDMESQSPTSGKGKTFPCTAPGCVQKPFSRQADLTRHVDMVHLPDNEKKKWFCDYERCERHDLPFHRQDHFRDHLREYHKEDLPRRGQKMDPEFWESRNPNAVINGWWRCNRCLVTRVSEEDGYICTKCNNHCEQERQECRRRYATWYLEQLSTKEAEELAIKEEDVADSYFPVDDMDSFTDQYLVGYD